MEKVTDEKIHLYLNKKNDNYFFDVYDIVESTNIIAKEKAMEGKDRYVALAMGQSKGRGRTGKSFYSPENSGLYFSVVLRKNISSDCIVLITTAICVAVARAIEKVLGIYTQIKWVNDLFYRDKKVCGISTEGKINFETGYLEYAVVGIGINLFTQKFPGDLEEIATGLLDEEKEVKCELVGEIINNIEEILSHIEQKEFLEEYKNRSYLIGKEIFILRDNEKISAKVLDIDDNAHLMCLLENGEILSLSSSEVSVRRK